LHAIPIGPRNFAGVEPAIDYASALHCPKVNCLAGILPGGVIADVARATLIENLSYAAGRLEAAGVGLLLEPVNTRDIPGLFVDPTRPALGIIAATGSSNISLQYDIYHAQMMEGDLARTIETEFDRIGHIQLADNPGRHEPGTGEITTRSSSAALMNSVTPAGSAANTNRRPQRRRA
jgi:hydroxypyruvate isomerase